MRASTAMENRTAQLRVIVETCHRLRTRLTQPESIARLMALTEAFERKLRQCRCKGKPTPRRPP
jgi:hypothetical protein